MKKETSHKSDMVNHDFGIYCKWEKYFLYFGIINIVNMSICGW
ncbi:unnamed protein product [Spirodela intermedia]|uniref:Uncharacterized protein n=1 Tax=Spirodela intermedia TaxID=51605 RepID=A0A7I8KEF3_SPIIN|nr:unnamed protein product [Spirodela intermedia]